MGIKTAAMEQNDRMDGAFEPRLEDYRLLIGAGNFQDDEATAGAAWGVFVRSPHAFADIRGVDTASAQAAPGGTRGADRRRSRRDRHRLGVGSGPSAGQPLHGVAAPALARP